MTREEVLNKLCTLCTEVSKKRFGNSEASDCFCPQGDISRLIAIRYGLNFQFSDKVIAFIEQAVKEKLSKGKS
ncbi:Uncharacterised protein [uncultured archaeon]|nr:Uncharacterised protein [uncultured archaeon]